jgi:hypothetical protein
MGDMGEGALHREDEVTVKQRNGTKTNWPTDRRSQCNLKLNLHHCTANYRPILSSESAPYMKNKENNCNSNKCNIWSPAPKRGKTPRRTVRLTVDHNVTSTSTKHYKRHAVAQWLRHYATSRKVMGSKPDEVNAFINLLNPFDRARPWGLVSL